MLAVICENTDTPRTQAAEDEAAVSGALAWAHSELAVPHVAGCSATAWLHSISLVRHLQDRLSRFGND